jgi:hypothetical protein
MALKAKLTSKTEIPVGFESAYIERDGAWFLDCPDLVEKSRLDEFRNNNIALTKQLGELKARFDGIDPDAIRAAAETQRQLSEGELLKKGDVEGLRKTWQAPLEKRARDAEQVAAAATAQLVDLQINAGALAAATKRGLLPTAQSDLAARARSVFRLVNGVPVSFEADGQTPRLGKDGVTPLTLEEWTETLVVEAPHLFGQNSGGGATGSSSGGAVGSGKNPFAKATWNFTEQSQLMRTDPKRAAALKAAAGV